jgi:hypothetical protein
MPTGNIVIPSGVAGQTVALRAEAAFGAASGDTVCADGTLEVTYTIDGTTGASRDAANGFPASFVFAPGDYTVEATARVVETGATLSSSRAFSVRTAPDANGDGLLDGPFANLTADGERWMGETNQAIGSSTIEMVAWFGNCEESDTGVLTAQLTNPSNATETLEVTVSRRLLDCGEQGIVLVQMADTLAALVGPDYAGFLPEAPDGHLTGAPYVAFTVLISSDGGQSFRPASNAELAAAPATVVLSGMTDLATGTTLSSYPLDVSNDGAGNVALALPNSEWAPTFVAGVLSDSTTIQASAKGTAVFTAFLPSDVPVKEEGVSCAPGAGHGVGGLLTDLLVIALLLGGLFAARRRTAAP